MASHGELGSRVFEAGTLSNRHHLHGAFRRLSFLSLADNHAGSGRCDFYPPNALFFIAGAAIMTTAEIVPTNAMERIDVPEKFQEVLESLSSLLYLVR